ncbi:MAG: dCMP deaminase family protein [Nitrospinae bacterium]|nr:dCMP deaminase family protein [Nitrospinota bacterium]
MGRPDWDDYFMKITRLVAQRATCLRRQVGALLVKDHRILTTGYNGAPSGLRHCLDIGCLREKENVPSGQRHELCRALHAEQNAILQAALHGVSVKGAVLYCTHHPCSLCAKMLVNAGVTKIIYEKGYPDPLASEILVEARLERLQLLAGEGEEG